MTYREDFRGSPPNFEKSVFNKGQNGVYSFLTNFSVKCPLPEII